jgi:hypothetical protein
VSSMLLGISLEEVTLTKAIELLSISGVLELKSTNRLFMRFSKMLRFMKRTEYALSFI